jgi:hypothetical protein
MRSWSLVVALLTAALVAAQPAWLPLSREVELPYAVKLYEHGSTEHTAIRPYRRDAVKDLPGVDSLRPYAAFKTLDRWAGVRNGRRFRWGPLVDASLGTEAGSSAALFHKAGAGFWMDADVRDDLSFHLNAQGWDQRFPSYLDTLVRATQVAPGEGYAFGDGPSFQHYDINGHVSWDPGKYFNFTVGRGRNFFGEGHRSLMLSDESYSYPYMRITTSVWRIKYVNLFTAMNDIRGAGGDPSNFQRKFTSMHYLSWNVSKRVNVALFEAIVWSSGDDKYPRGFDINYLNPIIFLRPVEFSIGSPDNALLGVGFNVKVGNRTLLYSQLVLDEFLLGEVRGGTGWYANKQAVQLGAVAREALGIKGLVLRGEWNYVRPFMYTHSDTEQNYSHFGQPLAHPFGSNLQEVIGHADRTVGRWHYGLRTSMAWMGSDDEYSYGNNIFRPESERPRTPEGVIRDRGYRVGLRQQVNLFHGEVRAGYLLDPSTGTRLEATYMYRDRKVQGGEARTDHVFRLGVVCHFRERHPEQEVRYVLPR